MSLPRTYGIDDFPILVQSKAFDILQQIAIATEMDTAIFVNGTLRPYQNMPAQIIRLRLLNGSSMRTYNFGFSKNQSFKLIGIDAGLIDSAVTLTRILISPGERVEILLDLQGKLGDTLFLKNYSSEMPNGIYGAATVTGMGGAKIPDYDLNPLNGLDYNILQIHVVAKTAIPTPILNMPNALVPNIRWNVSEINAIKNFVMAPEMMGPTFMVEGPFRIDSVEFDMDKINRICYLNDVEKWRWTNRTGIAHPIHIHDMHFYILNVNGGTVPIYERGKKDVVLIMPNEYVEFITKFETFSDNIIPYMYHCHLLHHEDDGMMGSFLVKNKNSEIKKPNINSIYKIYPNPSSDYWKVISPNNEKIKSYLLFDMIGKIIEDKENNSSEMMIDNRFLINGHYLLKVTTEHSSEFFKLIKY